MGDVVNTAQRLQTVAAPGAVVVGPATYAATARVRRLPVARARSTSRAATSRSRPGPRSRRSLPPGHRPRRSQTPFVGRDAEMGVLGNADRLGRRASPVPPAAADRRGRCRQVAAGRGGRRAGPLPPRRAACSRAAACRTARPTSGGRSPRRSAMPAAWRRDATLSDAEIRLCRGGRAPRSAMTADAAEVQRVTTGLLYLMGYEVPLREIDPATGPRRGDPGGADLPRAHGRRAPGRHGAVRPALGRPPRARPRRPRWSSACAASGSCSSRRPGSRVTERWTVPTGRHNTVLVNLDPLDASAAGDLLDALAEADVPAPVRALLLDRSGGNPFFLEELVALIGDTDLVESGLLDGTATLGELPDTLRGLVAARIDSLEPAERGSLEDASVWGRTGPVKALATMAEVMRGITDVDARARRSGGQRDPRGRRRALVVPLRPDPRGRLRHPDQGRPGPPPPRHRRLPLVHGRELPGGPRAPGRHGGLPLRRGGRRRGRARWRSPACRAT